MIPHKTKRGSAALARLQTFEGTPPPYDKKKRMVIPSALKVLRLKHGRRFCSVGRLSHEVGWKHQDIIETLEAKRKVKAEDFFKKKMDLKKVKEEVLKDPEVIKKIAGYQEIISSYGF
jgi:large subunit ribosomal protein L13Ae